MEPAQPSFWAMDKNEDAYRTISEAAEELDLPQHVLRFWETRFPQIKPMKRGGGRRYYRPDDLELLRAIRHLLYGEGYTIKGVQRMLKEQGPRQLAQQVELAAGGHGTASGAPPLSISDMDQDERTIGAADAGPLTASRDFPQGAEQGGQPVRPNPFQASPFQASPLQTSHFQTRPVQPGSFLTAADLRTLERALAELDACKRILQSAAE